MRFVYLYVDDLLIVSRDRIEIRIVKSLLGIEFERKDMSATEVTLEMYIKRDRVQR